MPTSFIDLGVRADIAARLVELEILDPYPIQRAVLPDAFSGLDLCAQSPTGSGKTLAFAIPLVARVGRAQPRRPRALVLSPTRELAAQIAEEIRPLAAVAGRRVASFYGGTGFKEQLSALARGVDIAVGCPGRLIDLLERGAIALGEVEIVVVDEADRMADMGFLPPVRRLLDEIRGAHQTMLFSATLAGDVERLVRDYQRSPRRHVLDAPADAMGSRTHEFWRTSKEERSVLLADLVGSYASSIVFCRTKRGVDRLARQLSQAGLSAVALHGDRSQAQRDRALAQVRDRHAQVLVATDVAARGIHVEAVDCVVHFDPPEDEDTYVHRSGRTGRAGATGRVVSLVTAEQEGATRKLQARLGFERGLSQPGAAGAAVRPTPSPRVSPPAAGGTPPEASPHPTKRSSANASSGGFASSARSSARRRNRRGSPNAPRPALGAGGRRGASSGGGQSSSGGRRQGH